MAKAAELAYDTRPDGVLYKLHDDLLLKVQRKSANRVKVTMERKGVIIPTESGDLTTSGFREKLVGLARDRFGGINGFADDLGLVAVGFEAHLKEREEDAAAHDEETNVPELVGTPYRVVNGCIVRLKNTLAGETPRSSPTSPPASSKK